MTGTGSRPSAVLGLGLAAIGRPGYITLGRDRDLPADRSPAALAARAFALLDAAAALGIGYVDAARSYGRAEEFLASWLRGRERVPFVASKWGYRYTGGWRTDADRHEVKEHTAAAFERQHRETTELLGPWLRLSQVHSLTLDSPLWADRPLLRRLAEVRAAGTEIGFSTSGPEQAAAVRRGLALTVDGVRLFSSVQSTWNLLETSAAGALAEAHDAGLRVVVKEAVANGRLTGHGQPAGSPLAAAAREHGVGVDAVALGAALARPWCDVVLSGAVTVAQLTSNAAGTRVAGLDLGGLVEPQHPGDYWGARGRLPWQ
ncbi:Predicted oxidoreductase [Geodermatophilus africanus]|uniref:Predicted oxidoreductase n=1 Tax=Geodermatophilus africanus TaxID=1137993 RepID=A0A1H3MH65_9ACTN|nr:aldo/keto reductase [Geodermatophilus africanus]SDY76030.1 Predicted oxidoreductase [Geodermatophilus africanus]